MAKFNIDLPGDVNKDIAKIIKGTGVNKHDWCVYAITLVRDKYLQKKASEKLSSDIQVTPVTDQSFVGKQNDVSIDEVGKTIQPLDETGQQPIPEYGQQVNPQIATLKEFVFFMNDGGEQKANAYSLQQAQEQLGIGDNDYLDWNES